MSKNQQKTTFNDASGLLNSWEGTSAQQSQQAEENASKAGTAATSTWNNLLSTGGYDPSGLATLRSNISTGFNPLESTEQTNLTTGGYDPSQVTNLSNQYQNLISTGGISDATAAAMQRQATSGVQSIYGTLANNLAATRAATGGEGGGGETAQMARQLAQQEANAVTGVNAEVGQLRQQGTEAGLRGASDLQSAIAASRLAAVQGYGQTLGTQYGLESGVESGVAGGRLASAGGLEDIYKIAQGASLGEQGLQLQGNLGYLDVMSGIANKQKGPFANFLDAYSTLTAPLTGG